MLLTKFLIIVSLLLIIVSGHVDKTPKSLEFPTLLGRVKGSLMKTRLGKDIYTFRGLRYGEPPVGKLRFKQAVPAKPWPGVFDASQEGLSCFRVGGQNVSDDCLRLNVYTTKRPTRNTSKSPVIVFFHPGGFYSFSGQSYNFGPQYLLDEDIVLVTVNYRLGAIGFTATGDALAPGNLGLKDQVEALRWVQKNIESFNGDASCVTIVGYSSGSRSAVLHMLSSMSRGLFHRIVAMSGSPIKEELLEYHQKNIAEKQARLVGCPIGNTKQMLECFENIPGEDMAATVNQFPEWHNDPLTFWSPVVEPDLPGVERFIVDQPVNLIRRGDFIKVPIMAGSNLDEFGPRAILPVVEARKGNNSVFDELNAEWDRIAPIAFQYERSTNRSRHISQQLHRLYFQEQSVGLNNWQELAQLYGDMLVTFPVRRMVDLISENSDQPVFYYHFVYQGRYSYNTWPDTKKPFGVVHHDDLMYLFYMRPFFPFFESNAPELPTVSHMTAMWASFAKTGNPIPKNNPLFANIKWNPYDVQQKNYLEINSTLRIKKNFKAERMAALERIFPIPSLTSDSEECSKDVNNKF